MSDIVLKGDDGSTIVLNAPAETLIVLDGGLRGETGAPGADGAAGPTGATGQGVPTGGTTNQYLKKNSATNYDTSWDSLDKTDVGLANVDNTADANKPVSTATQTALDAKQATLSLTTTGTSGAASLIGSTLNIPQYAGGGGGTAATTTSTPAGNITATNVQTALNELDTEKVAKAGDTLSGRLDFPSTPYDINNPAMRFTQVDSSSTDDHAKGLMLEWGGNMTAATNYPYGLATEAYNNNPSATFTVPSTGYKKWGWIMTHYQSPASTGESVHQHLNFETTKADYSTVVTRLQISFGEDTALISTPNSNVWFYNDKYFRIGGWTNYAQFNFNTASDRFEVTGKNWEFKDGQSVKIGASGAPGAKLHVEATTDTVPLLVRNTTVAGNNTPNINIETQTATSRLLQGGLQADANKRISILANGQIDWGDGTATRDTNLFRNAADQLRTNDSMIVDSKLSLGQTSLDTAKVLSVVTDGSITGAQFRASALGTASTAVLSIEAPTGQPTKRGLDFRLTSDSVSRLRIDATQTGGTITFGDGTSADTNLYRSAADTLKTDDTLLVAGNIGATSAYVPSIFATTLNLNSTASISGATAGLLSIAGNTSTSGQSIFPNTSTGIALYNTADQTTNFERMLMQWSGNTFSMRALQGGSGVGRALLFGDVGSFVKFDPAGANKVEYAVTGNGTASGSHIYSNGALTATSGVQYHFRMAPTISQTLTAGYTALLINPTETTVGSGVKRLADFQVGGVSKASIDNTGAIMVTGFDAALATKTANYTLVVSDYTVLFDATAANLVATLPTAASSTGRVYNIKKTDSTANTVTIAAAGAELIDGASTKVISTQYNSYTIQSTGTGWVVI